MRKKKWMHRLFHRRMLVAFLLLLQIVLLILTILRSSYQFWMINVALYVVSIFVVLSIINKRDKAAFKMIWFFLILLFPVFGGLFYLLFTFQTSSRRLRKRQKEMDASIRQLFLHGEDALPTACADAPECAPQMRYLQNYAGFPVYRHTRTEYLTPGERKFERLKQTLLKAEHYIFMEYFIVHEGVMWDSILEILKSKVRQGVEVRFLYDDMGCFFTLPTDYCRQLEDLGIHCAVFNPFRPVLSSIQNNRDHRKITVVDGKYAFTGGVNLADEYINAYNRFGHWKDAAILLEGEAAWSLTLIFLQMWNLCRKTDEDYRRFYPWKDAPCEVPSDGLVQPYADSPLDQENVGEHVYAQIINNAKEYLYINTPYLIVDENMVSALTLAAKSGVDVRIVTPHRWDKFLVHMTTRSYYRELIEAGVKVYEYSIGFLHSKTFVSDDRVATVGTTNLDFRSLYLHFECGVWLYRTSSVQQVKQDYLETLENCQQITLEDCRHNALLRVFQEVLRLFAPLM